ncbi:hypothetical protein [Brevibacterium antiquum]|uniref:Uncharacterized protein n=1 Tax=Brevibacterium antiquum TaxID=234835 RepID=A0A2H1INL5_9MICO|nr:hypothetical protein [Brevibacterium antiquum]SMX76758.1 hypothetical protein BANT10_01130 [Brevibacterium antiquum]
MPIDPRTLEDEQVGTKLRDGAVDPKVGDFLGPSNAGEDNPHGPTVVNPGLHALQDVRPVRPGAVSEDPTTQDTEETTHLNEWQPDTALEPGS